MSLEVKGDYALALQRVVSGHPLVSRLHLFPEVGSTNDEALRLARGGAPSGTLVVADRQTAGRGRHGRRWESPGGLGLWFSLLVRPDLPLNRAFGVTAAAAVALATLIPEFTGRVAGIRWPNDLLVGPRKVAGLLAELAGRGERVDFVVLGVGLNVGQGEHDFPAEIRAEATSLSLLAGHPLDRSAALDRFLAHFATWCASLTQDDGAGVRREWVRLAPMIGQDVRVDLGGEPSERFTGRAAGLAEDGALVIATPGGERLVRAADVRLLRPTGGGDG